uniref:Late embryogenesis abundant protein LEA-2 subgroup domain-containing protein n=5 Tax=Triticinae TaxID=1648030 RepID=A0A453D192_AEGTS
AAMQPAPTARTAGWLHRPLPRERPHLTRCTKILCSAFLTLLLVAGVLLFVAYLAVRPHRPRFHVTAFSAASVQQAGAGAVLLSGQLSIRNPNRDVAFFYDRLYMSVLYRQYGAVVKDHDLAGGAPMYQPPKTTTPLAFEGVAVPAGPATADMARAAAEAGGGAVEFTVKVRSRIRAKVAVWGFHWHPLHVDCDVAVGPDGQLLPEARQKRCDIDFL